MTTSRITFILEPFYNKSTRHAGKRLFDLFMCEFPCCMLCTMRCCNACMCSLIGCVIVSTEGIDTLLVNNGQRPPVASQCHHRGQVWPAPSHQHRTDTGTQTSDCHQGSAREASSKSRGIFSSACEENKQSFQFAWDLQRYLRVSSDKDTYIKNMYKMCVGDPIVTPAPGTQGLHFVIGS